MSDWNIGSVYRPSDDPRFPSLEVMFSDDIETVGQLRAFIIHHKKFGPGTLTFFGSNGIPALTEPDDTPIDDALRDCQFRTPDLGVQILWVSSASFDDSSILPPQHPQGAAAVSTRTTACSPLSIGGARALSSGSL